MNHWGSFDEYNTKGETVRMIARAILELRASVQIHFWSMIMC